MQLPNKQPYRVRALVGAGAIAAFFACMGASNVMGAPPVKLETAGSTDAAIVPIVLVEGTPITVTLSRSLKSGGCRDGDPLLFHTAAPTYSHDASHTLFVALNAVAMGRVIVSKRRGLVGGKGDLQFTCDYVQDVNGHRIYLRGGKLLGGQGHSNEVASVVTTLLVGYAGLLLNGRDIKVEKDTQFIMYVDQDTALHPAAK